MAPLTDPRGVTSAVGVPARRTAFDLPPIGTPEHTALLSGSLDLSGIVSAHERGPLVGFAPIFLDPSGPTEEDLADVRALPEIPGPDVRAVPGARTSAGRASGGRASGGRTLGTRALGARTPGDRGPRLPSRRSLRGGGVARSAGAARGTLPTPRTAAGDSGQARSLPAPPVVAALPNGALAVDEIRRGLAALPLVPGLDDTTPTGELARPFVTETALADWVALDDVPPPVSVDVFQKAVRAGLAPEKAAAALAVDPGAALDGAGDAGMPRRRTRRELRARERALGSLRGVTARRLAKGGVLAITALGVVSSATPHSLGSLGLDRDELGSTQGAMDFAGAVAPKVSLPPLSPEVAARQEALRRAHNLSRELADEAADTAGTASTRAGGAVLALARQRDAEIEARRQAALAAAARNAARDPRAYAAQLMEERGWRDGQFQCLDRLWMRESQWNYRAVNPVTGAAGIPQALPGSRMSAAGPDWQTNPITQMTWGLDYIEDRYGSPCAAWQHSEATGWY